MIEIGWASATSTAPPGAFHARWCDVETHPEWAASMEWFRLDGPFGVGARGTLRTRDGRESRFVVTEVVPGRSYADTTELDGAGLTVHHFAEAHGQGSRLTLRAWLDGAEEARWADEIGDISEALAQDLAALVALLESGPRGSV